jgi:glycosyltransferase involved in cell wall biosynthesis
MLRALRKAGRLAAHLDTSDERPVLTVGRFDLINAWLGVRHAIELVLLLFHHPGAAVYVPISQAKWGFVRDAVFIWTARVFRRPVIVHLHGGYFQEFWRTASPFLRWFIARTMAQVDRALVLTQAHTGIFDGLMARQDVSVLENTVDDLAGAVEGARDGHEQGSPTRLLYLSTLFPEKGCFDLTDALGRIADAESGIEVRFVGEASEEVLARLSTATSELQQLGISVSYDGPLTGEEKEDAFAWAEIFVLPSRYPFEGQPLALLEAMAASLPIVSTNHSGIPYTVRDEQEGLIVEPGDIDALAAALRRLIEDTDLRQKLGAGGRRRYEETYLPEKFDQAVAELFSS